MILVPSLVLFSSHACFLFVITPEIEPVPLLMSFTLLLQVVGPSWEEGENKEREREDRPNYYRAI